MLELSDSPTPMPFDPSTIDDKSEAEIDSLPFGVIAVDDEGTILRYNLYESRFARLDRNQVLGRNFFTEVAPCTRTPEFEGRFRAFVTTALPLAVERFEYLFDFKFGAQDVAIEMLRAGQSDRFYLLINRRRISAPRTQVPREMLAALQEDLAPEETSQGVLRDDLARRFIDTPAPFFAALRATCDRLAPDAWQMFSTEWGVQWGRRVAVDLEAAALESSGRSLKEMPMTEVATMIASFLGERGWGSLAFDFSTAQQGVVTANMERCVLAESVPRRRTLSNVGAPVRDDLACHLLAGWLSGILSSLAGRRLAAREVSCLASGAPRCTIVLVGNSRRSVLDETVRSGVRSVSEVLEQLRRAPRVSESTQ